MLNNPPAHLAKAFEIINDGRAKIGRSRLHWSNALHKASQELTDKCWADLLAGRPVDYHWDHLGRIERSGWPVGPPPPKMRPGWPYNHSEDGISGGSTSGKYADQNGWAYSPNKPEDGARSTVYAYTESNLSHDHTEGHVWDFRLEAWTHIGIGHTGGMFAMNYGYHREEQLEREDFNFLSLSTPPIIFSAKLLLNYLASYLMHRQ
jgi:hypothetical protein